MKNHPSPESNLPSRSTRNRMKAPESTSHCTTSTLKSSKIFKLYTTISSAISIRCIQARSHENPASTDRWWLWAYERLGGGRLYSRRWRSWLLRAGNTATWCWCLARNSTKYSRWTEGAMDTRKIRNVHFIYNTTDRGACWYIRYIDQSCRRNLRERGKQANELKSSSRTIVQETTIKQRGEFF